MASKFERLQNLLGQEDVYEQVEVKQENLKGYSSESDDDEKILNIAYSKGGENEQPLGYARGNHARVDMKLAPYNLRIGELASPDEVFCSLQSVVKYPYNYIGEKNRDIVAGKYFTKGKVHDRPWDLFYIYPPEEISTKAILLVPSKQLENFLAIINYDLDTQLGIPYGSGFLISFTEEGIQRPRYLGHSHDREMSDNLKQAVLPPSYKPNGEIPLEPTDRSLEAFRKKIERLIEDEKKKKKANKEKRNAAKRERQLQWNASVKRVQIYLGIRKSDFEMQKEARMGLDDNEMQWGDVATAMDAAMVEVSLKHAFSADKAPKCVPEEGVIFISVDVEAYERNHNLVTEVGIATLDTNDIFKVAPGENGINWRQAIRARHFRVAEYRHLNNHEFIQGCADKFEFGESEWVHSSRLAQAVASCFKEPYSGHHQPVFDSITDAPKTRQIVLVGHDLKQDIQYLKKIGYDPGNLRNLKENMDTAAMYRSLMREADPRGLGYVLANLGITGWYLHNAGNDAVYTLQAMLGIAVKELIMRDDVKAKEKLMEQRIQESVAAAVRNELEEAALWESDGEGGDGEDSLKRETHEPATSSGSASIDAQLKNLTITAANDLETSDTSDTSDHPQYLHPSKKAASGKCKQLAKQAARGEEKKVIQIVAERAEFDENLLAAMESIVAGNFTNEDKQFLAGEIERCRELSEK